MRAAARSPFQPLPAAYLVKATTTGSETDSARMPAVGEEQDIGSPRDTSWTRTTSQLSTPHRECTACMPRQFLLLRRKVTRVVLGGEMRISAVFDSATILGFYTCDFL